MNPNGNIKHGYHGTLTYMRWKSMLQRCNNQKASNYPYYGGKGITVWQPWQESFEAFLQDMGECSSKEMTLERLDNTLGYSPENCVWLSKAGQNKHRSCCIPLTHKGETKNLSDWARQFGMTPNTLAMRIRLGWTVERGLTQAVKNRTLK